MADTRTEPPPEDRRGAALSDDREYRYRLWRTWDAEKPALAFVMLNPSTADEIEDDPTIRRCRSYATEWGFGRLEVVNIFALRSPDPDALRDHPAPIGPENDEYLRDVCDQAETVIAAWGANGDFLDRGSTVVETVDEEFYALDTTKAGHPVHPLYQPADAEPAAFQYDP